jgi:uracil-DNA glycosylase
MGRILPSKRPIEAAGNSELAALNLELVNCVRCPRLVAHRETMGQVKRRAYRECEYWARPVPGFGDESASVLILGLAPGAHGSNRTGRMFTGDSSGRFLYDVLHATGFSSHPEALPRDDGLRLTHCYITAAVRCAPPDNKPRPEEIAECADYLDREIALLTSVRVVVALGRIAFDAYLNHLKRRGLLKRRGEYIFRHGAQYLLPDGRICIASYHPSNQNTQTGKLTRAMFMEVFKTAANLI